MTRKLSDTTVTLMKARGIVERGWCQHNYRDGDKHCIVGALLVASGYNYDAPHEDYDINSASRGMNAIEEVIGLNPDTLSAIPDWQDMPERTHAEVLEAFDKAIQKRLGDG